MAISKIIPWHFGLEASYHCIEESNVSFANSTARIGLYSYRSESAKKDAFEQPIMTKYYDFHDDFFPFTKGGNTEAEAYEYLKSLPEWSGCEDC